MPAEHICGASRALAGRAILVTRPRHQAQSLAELVRRCGGRALLFPLLSVIAATDTRAARRALGAALEASLVVFVSANAVREALALEPRLGERLIGRRAAAVGSATARALGALGVEMPIVAASGSSSEALLALDVFSPCAVSGLSVGVIKGEGGRQLLTDTLRRRGAHVLTAEVYRRRGPQQDFEAFLAQHGEAVDLAIVTSAEALDHLVRSTPAEWRQRVLGWPLVLPSPRVLAHARTLAFSGPMRAVDRMCDQGLVAAAASLLGDENIGRDV